MAYLERIRGRITATSAKIAGIFASQDPQEEFLRVYNVMLEQAGLSQIPGGGYQQTNRPIIRYASGVQNRDGLTGNIVATLEGSKVRVTVLEITDKERRAMQDYIQATLCDSQKVQYRAFRRRDSGKEPKGTVHIFPERSTSSRA